MAVDMHREIRAATSLQFQRDGPPLVAGQDLPACE
jgi:hypothetical protein